MKERARSKELFEYEFPNGNRIHVTNFGFTLWDDRDKTWVIDGSTIIEDNFFRLGKDTVKTKRKDADCPNHYAFDCNKPKRKKVKK